MKIEDYSWIEVDEIGNEPLVLYVESLYWSFATITLIGTKGTTITETIFTISILSCIILYNIYIYFFFLLFIFFLYH